MKNNRGLSLIELILFLCIIAIIVFLALPFLPYQPFAENSESPSKDTPSAIPASSDEPMDTNLSVPLPAQD